MPYPESFLDELRAKAPLAGVVGRRVKLTRRGNEHIGLCPFHKEKSPSFTVNEEKGFYHCFGCGEHGSVFDFVMRTEGVDFKGAVRRLSDDADLQVQNDTGPSQRSETRQSSKPKPRPTKPRVGAQTDSCLSLKVMRR